MFPFPLAGHLPLEFNKSISQERHFFGQAAQFAVPGAARISSIVRLDNTSRIFPPENNSINFRLSSCHLSSKHPLTTDVSRQNLTTNGLTL